MRKGLRALLWVGKQAIRKRKKEHPCTFNIHLRHLNQVLYLWNTLNSPWAPAYEFVFLADFICWTVPIGAIMQPFSHLLHTTLWWGGRLSWSGRDRTSYWSQGGFHLPASIRASIVFMIYVVLRKKATTTSPVFEELFLSPIHEIPFLIWIASIALYILWSLVPILMILVEYGAEVLNLAWKYLCICWKLI